MATLADFIETYAPDHHEAHAAGALEAGTEAHLRLLHGAYKKMCDKCVRHVAVRAYATGRRCEEHRAKAVVNQVKRDAERAHEGARDGRYREAYQALRRLIRKLPTFELATPGDRDDNIRAWVAAKLDDEEFRMSDEDEKKASADEDDEHKSEDDATVEEDARDLNDASENGEEPPDDGLPAVEVSRDYDEHYAEDD